MTAILNSIFSDRFIRKQEFVVKKHTAEKAILSAEFLSEKIFKNGSPIPSEEFYDSNPIIVEKRFRDSVSQRGDIEYTKTFYTEKSVQYKTPFNFLPRNYRKFAFDSAVFLTKAAMIVLASYAMPPISRSWVHLIY